MPFNERSILRVEGRDDKFVIENLLRRHGIDPQQVEIRPSEAGEGTGGKDRLLRGMKTAVTTSTGRAVGFVLDADTNPEHRWQAVRQRLDDIDLVLPKEIPDGGFVGDTTTYQARVGVWLMPDNHRSGALEEFLLDLVAKEDKRLLLLAKAATRGALWLGAAFGEARKRKAVLHAWLSWQETPGLPYGTAITARYFGHDSPAALRFVDWFRRVFPPRR